MLNFRPPLNFVAVFGRFVDAREKIILVIEKFVKFRIFPDKKFFLTVYVEKTAYGVNISSLYARFKFDLSIFKIKKKKINEQYHIFIINFKFGKEKKGSLPGKKTCWKKKKKRPFKKKKKRL